MLCLAELTKKNSERFTLGPLSVSLAEGSTLALFGKNGAGKSTLFGLITGNTDRTSGHASWKNHKISPEAVDLKKAMGYLPQESDLPPWVTPVEVLSWNLTLHQLTPEKLQNAYSTWDIGEWRHQPLAACSHGMQKRVSIALASMHDPELLILDEPFNALDIIHEHTLEQLILSRKKAGKTTILSTHSPLIAAELCDEAWILQSGQLQILETWPGASLNARAAMVRECFFGSKKL